MASINTAPLGGTRDFLGLAVLRRRYAIEIIERVYQRFGFEPLETPTMERLETLLGKYALSDAVKRDEDWQAVAAYAEGWLADLVKALRAAASAKSDLVALYLTRRHHYGSLRERITDELRDDFTDE